MAKLQCIAIDGMKMWFPSNDHEPPHFHVKRAGAWEYRIFFLEDESVMFEPKWTKTNKTVMSRQDREQIAGLVDAHRDTIFAEWELVNP